MNTDYFSRLAPAERRFVVVVAVVFFIVVNVVWVRPHFSDLSILKARLNYARNQLATFQAAIQETPRLEAEVRKLQNEGGSVLAEDQATEFIRTIDTQSRQSGVSVTGYGRENRGTNQFFIEHSTTVAAISGERQLVNFLYNLGAGNSLIRVRSLSAHPDQPRQTLNANITLVASYQKNPPPARKPAPAKNSPATPNKQ